jgi:chemotaxis signal transduction protein
VGAVLKSGPYLTFRVGRQDCAIEAGCVQAILPQHELVTMDVRKGWVYGYGSVHGREFAVVDLLGKLGIARGIHGREPLIVVVEAAGEFGPVLAGFLAQHVSEIVNAFERNFYKGSLRGFGRPRRILRPEEIMSATAELENLGAPSQQS